MRPLTPADIPPPEAFAARREELRARVIKHKAARRVFLGENVSLLFEDRETLRWQIMEMCRVEGITSAEGVAQELAAYNALLPGEGELSATLFIEVPQLEEIRPMLDRLVGLDEHVHLKIGGRRAPARFDKKQFEAERISAVQYIRFAPAPEDIAALKAGAETAIVIAHPNYRHEAKVQTELRAQLLADLQGGRAPLVEFAAPPAGASAAGVSTGAAAAGGGAQRIRVAIAGVGNCASALVQGIAHYQSGAPDAPAGLMHRNIGGFRPADVEVVAAFDIDRRKVGRPLEEAVFAPPNCAQVFRREIPASGVPVQMGPLLDGVAEHMAEHPEAAAFRPAQAEAVDVAAALRAARAEVLVCYLPVGAERAVQHYAQACLDAGCALVNCVPVFLASAPEWAARFQQAGLPLVGDDIKSQVGATIVHRNLARLFADRGVSLDRTYQLNTGGNTDFLNMLERSRLASKKRSKTEAVQSQLDERLQGRDIHIGPSDYVRWQGDNKVAFIRMEGRGFGGAKLELEVRLSVQDSPNSAGVVMDAVRCAKLGLMRGLGGPLDAPSAYYMKSPPRQMRDEEARRALHAFIENKKLAAV